MTSDEARDLFGEVVEGTLDPAQRAAFDAALEADAALGEEFALFRATLGGIAALGADAEDAAPPPDLLPKVQSRLRARSRGRFYRDRFAEQAGRGGAGLPFVAAIVALLVAASVWVAMQGVVVVEAAPGGAPAGRDVGAGSPNSP